MKRICVSFFLFIALTFLSGCFPRPEPGDVSSLADRPVSNVFSSDLPSSDSLSGTSSFSPVPPDGTDSEEPDFVYPRPFPEPSVVTPVRNPEIPVSEINAAWATPVETGEIYGFLAEFENGDFAVVSHWLYDTHYYWGADWGERNTNLKVCRYTKTGRLLWKQEYPTLTNYVYVFKALRDGGLLLLTDASLPEDAVGWKVSSVRGVLTRLDARGAVTWSRPLTHDYEYFLDAYEAENGDLYLSGPCNRGSTMPVPDPVLYHWEDRTEEMTSPCYTFSRRDKEGNLLAHRLVDREYPSSADGGQVCHTAYRDGVGLLADFGTELVCLDEEFVPIWSYQYTETRNKGSYKQNPYREDSKVEVAGDRIVVHAQNRDKQSLRMMSLSLDGRLLGEQIIQLPVSDEDMSWAYHERALLLDGRLIVEKHGVPNKKGLNAVELYFCADGKETLFDSFETDLTMIDLTPADDGGFFLSYVGQGQSEYDTEFNYGIATKYNAKGRTEYQIVLGSSFQPTRRGRIFTFPMSMTASD